MRTVKWNPFLSGAAMLLGGVLLWAGAARADFTTTNPAAILIFPKVVYDATAARTVDTVIQITNTNLEAPASVRCYLMNAGAPTGGQPLLTRTCVETDFAFTLSPGQPIMWKLSSGSSGDPHAAPPLFMGGSIPPAPTNPMYGELKCVQVGADELPIDSNDLKGEASIETVTTDLVDIRTYNAVGLQAVPGANNRDGNLVLGTEYAGCPNYLILDHFFDGAEEPIKGAIVNTELTLVPCTENFLLQTWPTTTVQYLVFNEFEQRFSTSRSTGCFTETLLSWIDRPTSGGQATSIFSAAVEGTLTGQTLIRGSDPTGRGTHGLLAVAEEFHGGVHSAAFGLAQRGPRAGTDTMTLSDVSAQQ